MTNPFHEDYPSGKLIVIKTYITLMKLYSTNIKQVEKTISDNKWRLETKFNKHYCGFKAGFFNAFRIKWVGSKTLAFAIKLSEKEAKKIPVRMTKYESQWEEATYYIEPGKTNIKAFIPLFKAAYEKLAGE